MADTRIANPEYKLEVDTLILEYTLFKAIEKSIAAIEYAVIPVSQESEMVSDDHQELIEAMELVEAFDGRSCLRGKTSH